MTDSDSLISLPEVTAQRGGIHFRGPRAEEAFRRRAEIHAQRVAVAAQTLGITEEQLEHLNDDAVGGHWEYAIRDAEGDILSGESYYDPSRRYRTAVEAVACEDVGIGDSIVRRWVPDAGEWGPVKP